MTRPCNGGAIPRSLTRAQEARRQRVIDAAMELGLEGGYEAVQMRDVAARAHVAMGTVYRYFSSKDHLLAAALVFWVEQLDARLAQVPARGRRGVRAGPRRPGTGPAGHGSPAAAGGGGLRLPGVAGLAAIECQQQMGAVMDGIIIPGHRRAPAPRPRRAHPDHRPRLVLVPGRLGQRLERHGPGPRRAGRGRPPPAPRAARPDGQSARDARGAAEPPAGDRGRVAARSGAWSNAQAGSTRTQAQSIPREGVRMRAAIFNEVGKEVIDIHDDVEVADPGPGEVRLKLHAAGVCHSDLSAMNGTLPQPAPAVLGHEGAGEIIEVGPGVDQVAVGDHVIVAWTPAVRTCRACLRGEANLCVEHLLQHRRRGQASRTADGSPVFGFAGTGTFAEEMVLPQQGVVKIPDDVPYEIGALIGCGVTTGVGAALNTAKVQPGSSVVVFGAGGVGISAIQGARIAGAAEIVAVDMVDSKLKNAQRFGATHGVKPDELDARQRRDQRPARGSTTPSSASACPRPSGPPTTRCAGAARR